MARGALKGEKKSSPVNHLLLTHPLSQVKSRKPTPHPKNQIATLTELKKKQALLGKRNRHSPTHQRRALPVSLLNRTKPPHISDLLKGQVIERIIAYLGMQVSLKSTAKMRLTMVSLVIDEALQMKGTHSHQTRVWQTTSTLTTRPRPTAARDCNSTRRSMK